MSIETQALQQTQAFLSLLASCQADSLDSDLIGGLQHALSADGFIIQQSQGLARRYLRGLAESSGGEIDFVSLVMVAVCVICAGFASGLTQGLLSLDSMEMEIKARSGTDDEKKYAGIIIPLINRHHLLLVTLMLWNASATEALPIFLSALVPEYVAIIISVTLVLFVGEIIPASILTGPKQLQITAALTPMVYVVGFLFFPIAYPISLLLDYVIGHSDMTMYNRTEISTMMRLHREEGVKRATYHQNKSKKGKGGKSKAADAAARESMFEEEEVEIIAGALKYREMAVSEVMTPSERVYMVSAAEQLSYKIIYEIFKSGYSRIPVYDKDKNDIVGLILAKDLIFVDPEDCTPVQGFLSLFGRKPGVVWHDHKLGETLNMFKKEKSHMAVVRDVESAGEGDPFYKVVGIITLEDIVEEILGTEIEDETDAVEDALVAVVRDPEMARLRTINNTMIVEDTLTEEEIHSIGIYLFTNVPQIQRIFKENMADLQKLVRTSDVITMTRKSPVGEKPSLEDYLYRQGKMSNTCTLILSGEVEVHTEDSIWLQREGIPQRKQVTKGPWSTLAAEVLEVPEGTYVPEFTASIVSETLRFVRMANYKSKKALGAPDDPHHPTGRRKLGGKQFASMYNINPTANLTPFGSKSNPDIHSNLRRTSPDPHLTPEKGARITSQPPVSNTQSYLTHHHSPSLGRRSLTQVPQLPDERGTGGAFGQVRPVRSVTIAPLPQPYQGRGHGTHQGAGQESPAPHDVDAIDEIDADAEAGASQSATERSGWPSVPGFMGIVGNWGGRGTCSSGSGRAWAGESTHSERLPLTSHRMDEDRDGERARSEPRRERRAEEQERDRLIESPERKAGDREDS